jgi:hypothetical protein
VRNMRVRRMTLRGIGSRGKPSPASHTPHTTFNTDTVDTQPQDNTHPPTFSIHTKTTTFYPYKVHSSAFFLCSIVLCLMVDTVLLVVTLCWEGQGFFLMLLTQNEVDLWVDHMPWPKCCFSQATRYIPQESQNPLIDVLGVIMT